MAKSLTIPKKSNERKIKDGIVVDTYEADFETQAGTMTAQLLRHDGAVCIAATHNNQDFYIVDQFRFGIEEIMTEFPAGKIDEGETPLEAARRELAEEIGYAAQTIVPLGKVYSSPAYIDEVIYLYYATDLSFVGQNLDEHEELNIYTLTLNEINEKIMNGSIDDSKSLAMAYRLENHLKNI